MTFSRSSSLVSISPFASLILQWTPSTCKMYFLCIPILEKTEKDRSSMLDSVMYLSEKPHPAHAPPKTSMEPENEALEEEIPFGNLSFSGSMLFFVGECCWWREILASLPVDTYRKWSRFIKCNVDFIYLKCRGYLLRCCMPTTSRTDWPHGSWPVNLSSPIVTLLEIRPSWELM